MIATTKFVYSYKDSESNIHAFVLNAEESIKKDCPIFDQYINNLFIGNRFSKIELFYMMDNGFIWESF